MIYTPEFLHIGERTPDSKNCFWRKIFLNITFKTTQHQGLQQPMSGGDQFRIHEPRTSCLSRICRIKHVAGFKNLRQQEVKERPQLVHVVLQRCPCDQKFADSPQPSGCLSNQRLVVFDALSLIQNHVGVRPIGQPVRVCNNLSKELSE